ncbi:MAG: helix-turn-helix transcriptional regulator [Deferribacteres bacterium]|nr:helix-turn-helix transcriptional regulator [candidate division KSB1 bacterium]MCB9500330.1 helix-turn-helix transcriptional regulator [Deferribacteres bacterium]
MNAVFTIGIFLAFFLSLLLATKKNKNLSDILLAIWLFIIGIHLTSYSIYSLGYWEKYPHLVGVTLPVPLLHGPMLFLYTLYSLRNDRKLRKQDYLHFAPAFLFYLYMCRFYFFYSAEQKILVDKGLIDDFAIFSVVALISFILSGLTYPVVSYIQLGKYKKLLDDNFSYDGRMSLEWLQNSILGVGLLYLVVAIISLLREGIGLHFSFNADYIIYSIIILFVFSIGFFGIRQQHLFSANSTYEGDLIGQDKPAGDYKKSGLKPEVAKEIHQRLLNVMSQKKLYTNPQLTLSDLAQGIDVSVNHLSQVINQYEKVNFHDFVNKYRIDEFIKNATRNKEFSLLAHAYDAGFNSKSSFNSVFKKHNGMTPSKYIAQLTRQT